MLLRPSLWGRTNGTRPSLSSPPMKDRRARLSERTLPQKNPDCDQAILKLKKNKAADAGGWTTETAQSGLNHPHLKQAVLQWIHGQAAATEGPARRRGLWRTHRLVCLDKGAGTIRPILIGMLWSKLFSHLLLKPAKSDLEVFLRDRQFGIGTPQGGLAMTTALKAHLADNPSHVVACLDFKNAFGTIDRVTCMQVLGELCPHSPAWLPYSKHRTGHAYPRSNHGRWSTCPGQRQTHP